ncbi:MAG: hypothetical protein ACRC8W_21140 [Plesiomonas shigelloides]
MFNNIEVGDFVLVVVSIQSRLFRVKAGVTKTTPKFFTCSNGFTYRKSDGQIKPHAYHRNAVPYSEELDQTTDAVHRRKLVKIEQRLNRTRFTLAHLDKLTDEECEVLRTLLDKMGGAAC